MPILAHARFLAPCIRPGTPLMLAVVLACNDPTVSADTDASSSSTGGGSTGSTGGEVTTTTDSTSSSSDGADSTTTTTGSSESGSTTGEPPCGNGVIDQGEQCEPGRLDGEDCLSQGFDGGRLACAGDCSFDTSGCTRAICGDGVVEGKEACDGAELGDQTCEGEGFYGGTLACTERCTLDASTCTLDESSCWMGGASIIDVGTLVLPVVVPMVQTPVVGVDVQVQAMDSSLGELELSVEHVPSATSVVLAQNICGPNNDIHAVFDQDAAAPPDCVEPVAIEDDVLPLQDLDVYLGQPDLTGGWELTIVDTGPGDTDPGVLIQWCVIFERENGMP